MDNLFSGYLPQRLNTDNFKDSIIVFDTNVLLNIYRLQPQSIKNFFRALTRVKQQVWIPHIVALEYNSFRTNVLQQEKEFLNKITKKLETLQNDLISEIDNKEHISLQNDSFKNEVEIHISCLLKIIEESKSKYPDLIRDDYIRDKLFSLFKNKVSEPLDENKLKKLYEEADLRFKHNIPPGYKDEKNKKNLIKSYGDLIFKSEYSDYIIWVEIINKAQKEKKDILFITNEKKDDWVWKAHGYILGPRPELVTELKVKTNKRFFILDSSGFLKLVSETYNIKISESTIEDVKSVSSLSWKDIVIQAFISLDGSASLNDIYTWIEKHEPRPLTENWKATTRRTIYNYCKDRDLFLGKEELFEALNSSSYRLIK